MKEQSDRPQGAPEHRDRAVINYLSDVPTQALAFAPMLRRKNPKLRGVGMRWAPPSAEQMIMTLETWYAEEPGYAESVDEALGAAGLSGEVSWVSAALLDPNQVRVINAAIAATDDQHLAVIDAMTGAPLIRVEWGEMCRFDVSPSPSTGFDTIGILHYCGSPPASERVASGRTITPDERQGVYFYILRSPDFTARAWKALVELGIPESIHQAPPML